MSGSLTGTNATVDASIPLQAGRGVPQANPLATIGQFANAANSLNNLKLFPGQLQLQQQQVQSNATSLAQQQLRAAAGSLIPLLAKPKGTISVDDVATGLGSAEKNLGVVTQGFLSHLSDNAPPPNTPGYDQYIRSMVASLSQGSPETAVGQVTLQHGPFADTGSELVPTTVAPAGLPNTGVVTPVAGAAIPKALTPTDLATQVTRPATDADVARDPSLKLGQPITETMEQRLNSQGAQHLVNPINPPGLPPSLRNPARAQQDAAPAATPPAAAPTGAVATGTPPGFGEEVGTSEQQYRAATTADTNYQNAITPLVQAERFLKSAKTGPGTDTANLIQSYITTWAPGMAKQLGIDPTKVADFDSAVKFLAQTALGQPGALTSDMRTQLSQVANASTHIQPAAALHVVQLAIGLNNMQHAAVAEFDKQYGQTPGVGTNWAAFMRDFQRQYDPRGFYWDSQNAAQKQANFDTASKDDRTRIARSIQLGRQLGIAGGQ